MKITKKDMEYLKGEKFDVDYKMKLEPNKDMTRIECLLNIIKNKNVIHVGCCDHLEVIKKKVENNTWLHKLMNEQCKNVIGIDINEQAIDYIKKEGYADNVILNNIITDKPIKLDKTYDYMVLGEIIEHVDNPVAFLEQVREKYVNKVDKLIVTAPNLLKYCAKGKIKSEDINSDHRYYFSPYTLAKILTCAGFEPVEVLFSDNYKSYKFLGRILTRKISSQYGMTITVIAKFK